jgi:hypothetical protein
MVTPRGFRSAMMRNYLFDQDRCQAIDGSSSSTISGFSITARHGQHLRSHRQRSGQLGTPLFQAGCHRAFRSPATIALETAGRAWKRAKDPVTLMVANTRRPSGECASLLGDGVPRPSMRLPPCG